MRKITEMAVNSFFNGRKNFKRNNTEVICSKISLHNRFLLHGNEIFSSNQDFTVFDFSLCGWNTNTTRERLNGILARFNSYIKQKNWNLFYVHNGKESPINENDTYYIDRNGNLLEE